MSARRVWQALLIALAALPALITVVEVRAGVADPADYLTRQSGWWALAWLLATLTVSPLVAALHAPALLPFRRTLGLTAFAYASAHLSVYVAQVAPTPSVVLDDLIGSPYIVAGFAAWLLLLPLAVTSSKYWMKRLGRTWARLHRLIYPAVALGCLHYLWLTKSDYREPALFALLAALLLAWRVWRWRRRAGTP
ncbi:protein-methionine-sulfoxide reductase heme-binding subunit MsrQ [Crenobacter intestini]|uniref:Protein-methionine-sulfoxide reductase heme-binding subunit MsrQ n=1 Tax=Crenobacter intestini TaxID=2563443 RepID=A0A4T0V1I4_9NEIS|nr:ferric reductase-like transmembrane domain-containing protein [Crenobacter intestini]TIC85339.1 sulfoxide reductase heme-binding subunit YedZ [Crenobacter intestini]